MLSGAIYGYRGLVKEIIAQVKKEINGSPVVVATGGDGKIVTDKVAEIDHFSQKLTLEGIRIAALRIFQH